MPNRPIHIIALNFEYILLSTHIVTAGEDTGDFVWLLSREAGMVVKIPDQCGSNILSELYCITKLLTEMEGRITELKTNGTTSSSLSLYSLSFLSAKVQTLPLSYKFISQMTCMFYKQLEIFLIFTTDIF